MSAALRGGCLCGRVRYEITQPPRLMYHCHCKTCRAASGASFVTNLIVPAEGLRFIAGEDSLRSHESSPGKHRHFCGACGSPVYSRAKATADMVSVRCGTLDDDPGIRPSMHAFTGSRAPWTLFCDDLPKHEQAP